MQHYVQKFADGTEQHMVRCCAYAFAVADTVEKSAVVRAAIEEETMTDQQKYNRAIGQFLQGEPTR